MTAEEQAAFLRSLDPWTLYAAYPKAGSEWDRIPSVFQDGVVVRRGDIAALLADPATHIDVPTIVGTNRDEPKIFMAFDPRLVRSAFGLPYALRDPDSYELEARYRSLLWKVDGVDSIAEALAAHRGVLGLPGPYFGPGQEGHLRLAFANVGVESINQLPSRLAGFTL